MSEQPSAPAPGDTRYFFSGAMRLFRMTPDAQERWDDDANEWVDVEDYVYRKNEVEADPLFVEVSQATAMQSYPEALADVGDDLIRRFEQKAATITAKDGEVTLTSRQKGEALLALAREMLDDGTAG